MELLRELIARCEKISPVTHCSKHGVIALLLFCAILPTPVFSETLVAYADDDGSRLEASDEPCKTAPTGIAKNSRIFRGLSKGVSVVGTGCWEWAEGSTKLHIMLWDGGEYFIPASEFKSSDEAERLYAQRIKDKQRREYIENVYRKAELAKAEAQAAKIAEEMAKVEAAKPKTWISFSKYGRVVLTQKPCGSKVGGNTAYVTKPDHEMNAGCWQYRDANIVVTVDGKEYMYTPNEFTQQ